MTRHISFKAAIGIALLFLAVLFISCEKDDDPETPFKVALLVDEAGIDDKTFNQSTYEGIVRANEEVPFAFEYQAGQLPTDYPGIINDFIADGADLIVSPGYNMTQAMTEAATQYPDVDFLLLDDQPEEIPPNMTCVIFQADKASFLCGFVAAYWANFQDQQQPCAAFVGGPKIAVIEQMRTGYENGVDYFNEQFQLNVIHAGGYTADFVDSARAAFLADSLIASGAEVIFAFAGLAGNAALTETRANGKWGIGTDSDQYFSHPEVGDILLTSCIKDCGELTYQQLIAYSNGMFEGGKTVYGDLSNHGVGLAPFHDYETLIPDSVSQHLEDIKAGIIDGTISTGW